jgi:hypothetical protein
MGSHASQTNELERWQIAQHVLNLKAALKGEPGLMQASIDTTQVNTFTATESTMTETSSSEQQ